MPMTDANRPTDGAPLTRMWLRYRPRYRSDIEGLRAIAVLIVVAFHARVPGFDGGFVGVDVFFVLSGYLITWILVDEAEQTGGVDLRRFYARRARRLLPALAVVLTASLGVAALLYAPFEQRMLARTWAATALYVSNIDFAHRSLDYHGASAETNPLLHTWSLSVEEQFYLVWPWLVLAAMGLLSRRRGGSLFPLRSPIAPIAAATAISFGFSIWLTETREVWAFYLPLSRAWEFGAGALAVLLPLRRWRPGVLSRLSPGIATGAASLFALLGLGVSTVMYDIETPFPGIAAVIPVVSSVVLLRAGAATSSEGSASIGRMLSIRPLQTLGKLSYSWYLWHWPALVFAAALFDHLPLLGRLAAAAVALMLAHLSYTYVEDPLRHSRTLTQAPSRSFAMAVGVAVGIVVLAGAWWSASNAWSSYGVQAQISRVASEKPRIYVDGCDRFGRADIVECVYGDSAAEKTVVLVGDSHAGQYFPAVYAAAGQAGWRLVVLTLSACPFVEVPALYNRTLGRSYLECPAWRQAALAVIERLSPDLVIVGTASGYEISPELWEAGTRAMLPKLTRRSDRVVLLLDPPYLGIDMPACLARTAWRWDPLDPDCTLRGTGEAASLVAAQRRATSAVTEVELLDVWGTVCRDGSCLDTSDGMILYRDGSHLSTQFVRSFTQIFSRLLHPGRSESSPEHRDRLGSASSTGLGNSGGG